LAGLHDDGLGVTQNLATAAVLYRRAADLGHVISQLRLGEHYRTGRGLPPDPVDAYVWFGARPRNAINGRPTSAIALRPRSMVRAERRPTDAPPKETS
jgi:hypothetical protein